MKRIKRCVWGVQRLVVLWVLAWLQPACAAAPPQALEVGVFPYLSARALLDVYEPVREALQKELKRPTHLFTAPSFKVYFERTLVGAYDVALIPPHLARLAQREAGYVPLTMFTRELRGVIVVKKHASIKTLPELKDKRVATPNKVALVSIVGEQLLQENGLVNNSNLLIHDVGSHSNAVLAVQRGEAEAAITENAALSQMPEELRNSVRILAQTQRLPHVMFLAHPRLGSAGVSRVRTALLQFAATPQGRAFLKRSGFEGMRTVEEDDMKNIDPILKELKAILEAMPR